MCTIENAGELGWHRIAEVVLIVSVLNDVERRPVLGGEPCEGVIHQACIDGDDRARVPDHSHLESPLQLGERRRPLGGVGVPGPGVAEVRHVRHPEARGHRVRDEDRRRRERRSDDDIPSAGLRPAQPRTDRERIPQDLRVRDQPRLRVELATPRRAVPGHRDLARLGAATRRAPAIEQRELGSPRANYLDPGHLGRQPRILR